MTLRITSFCKSRILLLYVFFIFSIIGCQPQKDGSDNYSSKNWKVYGGEGSNQYSFLDQINRENAASLQVAWTYDAGDSDPKNRSQIQCNPLIIDGILYASSARLDFFALDAATGEEIWRFKPFEDDYELFGMGVNRGLVYWADGDNQKIFGSVSDQLFAIDAKTGKRISSFGENGQIDLHTGLGEHAADFLVTSNTPGVIFEDLLIMGTRVSESNDAAPGYIRAFNVHSGEIEWMFHTIPQPGEFGYETWPEDSWEIMGGANVWTGMTVDHDRGILFAPTGSASYDFYGGNRKGQNLFANCLLAINARTGKRIWHYQTVHHDLWDRDLPAAPNLVTVEHDGKMIDAVAQITKSAHVFLFNRETGEPLFPIEEIFVLPSDLEGEHAWVTQPIPTKPPSFGRHTFADEDVNPHSSEKERLLAIIQHTKRSQPFTPPSREGTLIFPGYDGGGEWGGAAADPNAGIMYVNGSEMPWILTMVPVESNNDGLLATKGKNLFLRQCAVCHGADRKGTSFMAEVPSLLKIPSKYSRIETEQIIGGGKGLMPAFKNLSDEDLSAISAFLFDSDEKLEVLQSDDKFRLPFVSTGYHRFVDKDGYPAIKPPWGNLSAIDLNKGEILWQVPLGEFSELTEKGIPITGTENYGGPVVTAGGVIFIGASKDEKFRVFDKESGEILWETELPAGGYATPSTYEVNGKQYVVIAAGGGKMGTKSGSKYVAFSLP